MNDTNFIFRNGITQEEKIKNLNEIISLLSQKLEMDLKYIDIESIIINKEKESVKYFLILFINILKCNESYKQKIINKHFNNDIELLNRNCITERYEKENSENKKKKINLSFDMKLYNDNKNNNINSKFEKILMNITKNVNNNINQISNNYTNRKINQIYTKKKTDLNIFYIPPLKQKKGDEVIKSKIKFYNSSDKKYKKFFHIYLSQKELIYEVVKIIKNIISYEDFYNFLISNSFPKIMRNIIEKIYCLHFVRHNNLFISKHYLKDHEIDINSIILRELSLYEKYSNYKRKKKIEVDKNKSNKSIKELSKLFKNTLWLRKFYEFNRLREEHEIKETKINYEYKRSKNFKYINDFQKLFLKLISIKGKMNKEDKELIDFLFNLKYFQIIEQKVDIINNLKMNNKELKILQKHNLLI